MHQAEEMGVEGPEIPSRVSQVGCLKRDGSRHHPGRKQGYRRDRHHLEGQVRLKLFPGPDHPRGELDPGQVRGRILAQYHMILDDPEGTAPTDLAPEGHGLARIHLHVVL
jgi:hypothetical protein